MPTGVQSLTGLTLNTHVWVRVFVQISEESQRKKQVDSLFYWHPRSCQGIGRNILFCRRGTVSWRVHKQTFVENEVVLDLTAATSQTVSKLFHNASSENYCFILIMFKMVLILFSMTLANRNSG